VAYLAHIGGFAVGMLMTYLIVPNRPRGNQPIVQPAVIVDRRPDY
jgi:membrane associated rhomboid family serine protease